MAFELQKRGYEVSVMTAIPDYPNGSFFKGYGILKKRRETIKGVKVHRSFVIPRGAGAPVRLSINYLSYTLFASLKAIIFGLTRKFDVILVHETSPIMVGIPAVIIKKMQRLPLHFWVLDLWPESLSAAGNIHNKGIISIFKSLTNWIYRNSNTLLIGSKGYRKSISQQGPFEEKMEYYPNWVDEMDETISDDLPELPKEKFNVVFTGNIGDAQDFPHVIEAAKILKENNRIQFIIIGEGRKKEWVEEQIKLYDLTNVKCLGRFPMTTMPYFYRQASILFLALKDQPIFALTAPAKLQAYMAAGKPIVGMINGDGADLIKEADCGWSVPAEDSSALANLLLRLSHEDNLILDMKGQNGKAYSEHHFNFKKSIDRLEEIINHSTKL